MLFDYEYATYWDVLSYNDLIDNFILQGGL